VTLARCSLFLALAALLASVASAENASPDDRIAALERQVQTLTEEISKLRTESAVPEDQPLASEYGLGPAASKVYGRDRGVSIGGYGELNYTNPIDDEGTSVARADAVRLITYLGYKFNDRLVFNSEIEFEHALIGQSTVTSGSGEVAVEFAALDFNWKPELNFRAGMVLMPVGFINEIHEPPYYFGVLRPETETRLLPATWRELGAGVFGNVGETFEYRAYVTTGFNARGFGSDGFRSGRQRGNRAFAEDAAFVARADWSPDVLPGLELGGSIYYGGVDQEQAGLPDSSLWIGEIHAQYRRGGFSSRALFAYTGLSNAGSLSTALGKAPGAGIASNMLGGYFELGYDVWPLLFGESEEQALEPYARIEFIDTQHDVPSGFLRNENFDYWVLSTGLSYFPHPNVVLKAEYRNEHAESGLRPDQIAVGIGFAY
jgi:opacity protein-like surface antigen